MPDMRGPIKPEMRGAVSGVLEIVAEPSQSAWPFEASQRGRRRGTGRPIARSASRLRSMAMFNKILVAVDLSDPAPEPMGLNQAVELANASKGLVRLVNIQPLLPATFMEYVPADFDAEQEKRATAALQEIVAAVPLPQERLSGIVRIGGIYHEILGEASDWGADLIVVGSHRPVVTDYLLGSNAKTIVRHALCSVLVVRP
jgi:universal stress protein F